MQEDSRSGIASNTLIAPSLLSSKVIYLIVQIGSLSGAVGLTNHCFFKLQEWVIETYRLSIVDEEYNAF